MNILVENVSAPDPASLAARLGALSHPARLEILAHLSRQQCCCCKDVVQQLDLAQSTVSQHLKVLVEAGLVQHATDRQRSLYRIDRKALAAVSRAVSRLVDDCCARPEEETAGQETTG